MNNQLDMTIKYSREDITRLKPYLKNWTKVHAYIRQMPGVEKDLLELRKLITIELASERRIQMVTRLRSRFIAIRKHLEDQILFAKLHTIHPIRRQL